MNLAKDPAALRSLTNRWGRQGTEHLKHDMEVIHLGVDKHAHVVIIACAMQTKKKTEQMHQKIGGPGLLGADNQP